MDLTPVSQVSRYSNQGGRPFKKISINSFLSLFCIDIIKLLAPRPHQLGKKSQQFFQNTSNNFSQCAIQQDEIEILESRKIEESHLSDSELSLRTESAASTQSSDYADSIISNASMSNFKFFNRIIRTFI